MSPDTNAAPRKALAIGMATYDDYDGVYFSVMALRLYHPEIGGDSKSSSSTIIPAGPAPPI